TAEHPLLPTKCWWGHISMSFLPTGRLSSTTAAHRPFGKTTGRRRRKRTDEKRWQRGAWSAPHEPWAYLRDVILQLSDRRQPPRPIRSRSFVTSPWYAPACRVVISVRRSNKSPL